MFVYFISLSPFLCCIVTLFVAHRVVERHRILRLYIPLDDLQPVPTGMPIIAKGNILAEQPLLSPLSKKPCVYYRYSLEQTTQRELPAGQKLIKWAQVGSPAGRRIPFCIRDSHGTVTVLPGNAVFESPHVCEHILDCAPKEATKGFLRATEYCVFVDQAAYVYGVARNEGGEIMIEGTQQYPLIISNRSREQILSSDQHFGAVLTAIGVIGIVFSLVFLFVGSAIG